MHFFALPNKVNKNILQNLWVYGLQSKHELLHGLVFSLRSFRKLFEKEFVPLSKYYLRFGVHGLAFGSHAFLHVVD
jgi:hypothetical protein